MPGEVGGLHVTPADLGLGRSAYERAGRAGDELRPQADPEQRHAALDQLGEQRTLPWEPRVLGVLVRMHRAAEGDHGVVVARVPPRRAVLGHAPLVQLGAARVDRIGEYPGTGIRFVDDREHAHAEQSRNLG